METDIRKGNRIFVAGVVVLSILMVLCFVVAGAMFYAPY